jgi:hypothetical protein
MLEGLVPMEHTTWNSQVINLLNPTTIKFFAQVQRFLASFNDLIIVVVVAIIKWISFFVIEHASKSFLVNSLMEYH